MAFNGVLGEQADHPFAICTHPGPQVAGFGVFGLAVMAKVFVHRWPLFAQLQRQAGMEGVVGGNAMGDYLGLAEQKVTADFIDHEEPPL